MIENIGLQDIYLDVSTKLRQKTFYANEVDTNGRGLHAFLQDNGVKVNGTGVKITFRYKSLNDGESKVYDFVPIGDPTNGEFELYYPTEMVRGHGNKLFPCTIVANDLTSELAFENVFVYVNKAEVNTEGVEASNEYSALKKSLDDVLVVQEQLGNITPEQIAQVTTAETGRVTAESGRATAETTRGNSETSRVSAETGRTTAEGLRVTAESSRVIAEDLRETAEATREANDQARGTYVEAIEANYAPELATVKSQLAETAKRKRYEIIPVNKKNNFEGREIIAYCNSVLGYVNRATTTQTLNELVITKTDAANPATIPLTTSYVKNPFTPQTIDFVLSSLDWSQITQIEFRLYPGDGGYYYKYISVPKDIQNNVKTLFRVHIAGIGNTGATNPLKITATGTLNLLISGNLNAKLTLHNGFFGGYIKKPVLFQFDDGNISVYEKAFPLMKERGIVGTFNVVTDSIGVAPETCSWEQLREMQDAGWTIGNHTDQHLDLMTGTIPEAVTHAEKGQKAVALHGLSGNKCLVPPFNNLDATRVDYFRHIMQALKKGTSYITGLARADNYISYNSQSVKNITTTASIISAFEGNIYTDTLFSMCFHVFTDGATSVEYNYNINDFETLLDYFVSKDVVFINAEQLIETYLYK